MLIPAKVVIRCNMENIPRSPPNNPNSLLVISFPHAILAT